MGCHCQHNLTQVLSLPGTGHTCRAMNCTPGLEGPQRSSDSETALPMEPPFGESSDQKDPFEVTASVTSGTWATLSGKSLNLQCPRNFRPLCSIH